MLVNSICVIAPCFNEEGTIQEFYNRLDAVSQSMPECKFEFIFVDDGSTDATVSLLRQISESDQRVRLLILAKNMGHQVALTAGLDFAEGDMIVTIDSDLQDPPELILELRDKLQEGFDIVHAKRRTRQSESWFKLLTAKLYYWFLHILSREIITDCGDFRAFSGRVLHLLRFFRERHRFLRGLFASLGFRQTCILYDRDSRYAGETKFTLGKMIRLAYDGILGHTTAPLLLILICGMFLWGASLIFIFYSIGYYIIVQATPRGWLSMVLLVTFFVGLILMCLWIIGIYISKVLEEEKKRPLYWMSDMAGFKIIDEKGPQPLERIIAMSMLQKESERRVEGG
jgi:dolichol-phosphate mannosyltransferase